METAHALGIGSPLSAYFSIGLGSLAVNPLEMARAYATLANGGRRVDGSVLGDRPRVVERVERIRTGRVEDNTPQPTRVLDDGEAEVITGILEDVVRFGTGRAAIPGRSVARKTGTTDNYGDAWFVGYSPELVVAVWVGYPDRLRPMLTEFGGEPVTGGMLPAQIWKRFMESVDEDEDESFPSPPYLGASSSWVVKRQGEWQLDNGYCREARLLVYLSGHAGDDRRLQAQRGLGPARRRHDAGGGDRRARRPTARRGRVRAREAGTLPRHRREPGAAARRPLGGRRRPAVGLEGATRPAPEPRRVERRGRQPRAPAAEAPRAASAGPGPTGTVVGQRPRPGSPRPGQTVRLVVGDGSGT